MSTPTIEQIHRHASVRKYKPDPVPRDVVETIVGAGQRASTSSNLQAYSVVAVTAPDRRAALAELCGDQEGIRQAPVFLAWCADLNRLDRVCEMRGYEQVARHVESLVVAVVDAAVAMQNAALAAESLGLGMCYIGAIRNHPAEVIELLELPRLVFPVSGMTLGWAGPRRGPSPGRGCRWGQCCTGRSMTPALRRRPCWPTTRPWSRPASMTAGRCPSPAAKGRWRTMVGRSTRPAASRNPCAPT